MLVLIWLLVYLQSFVEVSGETCSVTNYTGTVSITNGWRTCQLWSEQVPHRHAFTGNDYFPFDGSVEEAENYCRQVDGDKRPWCYTTDTYMRWQYCDDHICGVNGTQCGGVLTVNEGILESIDRNEDNVYDADMDCLWTLVAPEDKVIKLTILTFDVEEHQNCVFDYLLVYEDSLTHGMFCGTNAPSSIKSWSQTLYVRFHSDEMTAYTGFTASFSHVLPSADEGGKENATLPTAEYGNMTCQADINLIMYDGTVQITDSGKTCLDWAFLNVPDYQYVVDGSAANAKNYCRNIHSPLPWCVTQDTHEQEMCIAQICKDAAEDDDRNSVTVTSNVNPSELVASSTLSSWTKTSVTVLNSSTNSTILSTLWETSDLPSTLSTSSTWTSKLPDNLSSATPIVIYADTKESGQNTSQLSTTGIQTPARATTTDGLSASTGLTPPTETSGCKKRNSLLWLITQTVLIAVLKFRALGPRL